MSRSVLLSVIIVSGLVCAIWFLYEKYSFTPSVTYIIEMSEEGFMPEELQIQKGDRVIFANVGTFTERWPASDLHPTHELYVDFDSREPVLPGESWPFVFTEPGQWRFHDHLHPNKRGVVIVLP